MRLLLPFVFLSVFFTISSKAGNRDFYIDTSLRAGQPLSFKRFRIISPSYFDPQTPVYYFGRAKGKPAEYPIADQILALLSANACSNCGADDMLTISIREFRFSHGEIMSLFIRADFFTGEEDALHHIYTLDTFFQRRDQRNSSDIFAAESLLECAYVACKHKYMLEPESLTDAQADNYYDYALKKFPLYARENPPVGLFKTIRDLIQLSPADTNVLFQHTPNLEGDGYNYFYYKNPDGSKGRKVPGKDYFAGSDGKDFWISSWDGFHKLRKIDGDLYYKITSGMLAPRYTDYQHGALGALISIGLDEAMGGASGRRELKEIWGRFSPWKRSFIPATDNNRLPR